MGLSQDSPGGGLPGRCYLGNYGRLQQPRAGAAVIADQGEAVMAAIVPPTLRLQANHTNRPYGGAWWPAGDGMSHELLDLMTRWPADRPSIASYAYLHDDWDRSEAAVPARYRTRTLILILSDRSSCR